MSFEMMKIPDSLILKQAATEIERCNEYSSDFGLALTASQAMELAKTRFQSLRLNGRVEFGGGVIEKLIRAFCDSPYINEETYAETLHELTEMFYYYKNEAMDMVDDDTMIAFMKKAFNGVCQGSLALLEGRELARMAKNVRFGRAPDAPEEDAYERT